MVLEAIIDNVVEIVLVVGIPLLIGVFYLEGLILGKILQAPAVFVSVVAIVQPRPVYLVTLSAGCMFAVVFGQWTVFRSFDSDAPSILGIRERWPQVEELPVRILDQVGERRLAIIDGLFTNYGGIAVFVTTFVPVVRGTLAVPAGLSQYPVRRFIGVSLLANACYFPLLVGIAYGILHLLGI